jgi:hypothetical protein
MARKSIVTGLTYLAVVTACAATVVAVVIGMNWTQNHVLPRLTVTAGLVFSIAAPLGVALVALQLTKFCNVIGRVVIPFGRVPIPLGSPRE